MEQGEGGSAEARLAEIARRIDEAAERSATARDDTRARVEVRLSSLRARASRARTLVDGVGDEDASRRGQGEALGALETDAAIVEAQLDLDEAVDADAFSQAVRRALHAYRACIDSLLPEDHAPDALTREIRTAEELIAIASARLDRFERAPSDPSPTGLLVVLDDVDRTCRSMRAPVSVRGSAEDMADG